MTCYNVAVRIRGRLAYFSQEPRNRSRRTHCTDNRPSWKVGVFAMLGVRKLCFSTVNTRIRSGSAHPDFSEPGANHVFPYQITFLQNNSAQNCLTQCSTFGYPAAGMENGTECCVWFTAMECLSCGLQNHYYSLGCGDVADITNNGGTTAPETDCTMACSGDSSHLCGGSQRLQRYLWNGVLNNWQTPTNIGQYEVRTNFYFYSCARAL